MDRGLGSVLMAMGNFEGTPGLVLRGAPGNGRIVSAPHSLLIAREATGHGHAVIRKISFSAMSELLCRKRIRYLR
jgi:hypothetical protein